MKNKTKKNYLLGIILSALLIVGIINVTNGINRITINVPDKSDLHRISVFSLFLGDANSSTQMSVDTGSTNLDILNGLIVNSNNSHGNLSTVGGGKSNNIINANNAGIAGGESNIIQGENGAIGGGKSNTVEGKNGVIAGGLRNRAGGFGIILGGDSNISSGGGIVLGGKNNNAQNHSIALGQNAKGDNYSFAWNGHAPEHSARINASGGVLIGTYNSITGVSLVVSGAIKLGQESYNYDINGDGEFNSNDIVYCQTNNLCDVDGDGVSDESLLLNNLSIAGGRKFNIRTGGIGVNGNGCIQFYDGSSYNTLGKISKFSNKCGINTGCIFGSTTLHNGDQQIAYSSPYAKNCEDIKQLIKCENGYLTDNSGGTTTYIYPYCYNLPNNSLVEIESGYQNCRGLPEHAQWLNPYFIQRKVGDTYTPQIKSGHYSENPNEECAFTCTEGYTPQDDQCIKPAAYLLSGQYINKILTLVENNVGIIRNFKMYPGNSIPSGVIPEKISDDLLSPSEVFMWYDSSTQTMYYYTDAETIYLNSKSNGMFQGCTNLTTIDTSKWDTSKVKDMSNMFKGCSHLITIDTSKWDTSKVNNMSNMFQNCSSLENLDLSKWDTSDLNRMLSMFEGCSNLRNITFGNKRNTSNVMSISEVFKGCSKLESLDLSNWDISKVIYMQNTFNGCSNLRNITFGNNWNTNLVQNMSSTFQNCSGLENLDLSNWNTSNVKYMNAMFHGCSNLRNITFGNGWNTSFVENMNDMFYGCSKLESLDLSNWYTSNVQNMDAMFLYCSSLESLNLSSWDTHNVSDMTYMFGYCSNLKTIYVSDKFTKSNLPDQTNMFDSDTKIVGGNGTTYITPGVYGDSQYARIDKPGEPGYFTWYCEGDVNQDNLINEEDSQAILRCMADDCTREDYDLNNDGYIDGDDIQYILNMMAVNTSCN